MKRVKNDFSHSKIKNKNCNSKNAYQFLMQRK